MSENNFYKYCIFLDIDGVLNNEIFYKSFKDGLISEEARHDNIDKRCVDLLNDMIDKLGGVEDVLVVMSSTWRNQHSNISEFNPLFKKYGAIWDFIERTPNSQDRIRGVEIYKWLQDNSKKYFDIPYYDFKNYAILDDDSDMLLWQKNNFYLIDSYCGLTHNVVYRVVKNLRGLEYCYNRKK